MKRIFKHARWASRREKTYIPIPFRLRRCKACGNFIGEDGVMVIPGWYGSLMRRYAHIFDTTSFYCAKHGKLIDYPTFRKHQTL